MTRSAIDIFVAGYKRFKSKYLASSSLYPNFSENGQQPKALVIACCDSRVDPAIVLDAGPGDIFTVRNIANLVPAFDGEERHQGTSAAVEYAVKHLGVSDIIVLGHSQCGGINALMTDGDQGESDFIHAWIHTALPVRERVLRAHADAPSAEQNRHCEQASILQSIENLRSYPWVAEQVSAGKLALHAWYFDFAAAEVSAYQAEDDAFVTL